jgi:hypothetical protein
MYWMPITESSTGLGTTTCAFSRDEFDAVVEAHFDCGGLAL